MRTAILLSGGLDSTVLLAEEAARGDVQPLYVSVGLAWEDAERESVAALLAGPALQQRVRPLACLSVDMRDVYAATHWAVIGTPPGYHTPDENVYLPGRNIVLLGKAAVYCAATKIDRLVLGTLAHNPFPDATPAFRAALAHALTLGLAHKLEIDAPFAAMGKAEVIRRGVALGLPLELTLSCMSPVMKRGRTPFSRDSPEKGVRPLFPRHCGTCSKCRERHDAFVDAGVGDPTDYADRAYVTGTV